MVFDHTQNKVARHRDGVEVFLQLPVLVCHDDDDDVDGGGVCVDVVKM